MYECPVCYAPELECKPYATWPPPSGLDLRPPYAAQLGTASYEVCANCGFEFGFDDDPGTVESGDSFESYRIQWLMDGRPRFDPASRQPETLPPPNG